MRLIYYLEDAAISSFLVAWGFLFGSLLGEAIGFPLLSLPVMLVFFAMRRGLSS